jgi:6-phosphogluconolactonase/glucosamine-6-phosphate isomerase/deaminase
MKKNYLLKKLDDDQKLFVSCLKIIKREKYFMISGGKTFFPLHTLIDKLKNRKKIYITLSDERIVNQEKNKESNFYNIKKNIKKNSNIKILGFVNNLNKINNSKILDSYEKKTSLKKIKKIFISPGIDGHFASVFSNSKVIASSKNFEIIKKEKGSDRLTLKFAYFKKKKIYVVLTKKKRKILDMIKNNNIKYPIVNLIQQCKKKVTIIYAKGKI